MKTSDSIITAIAVDDEPRALELIGIHAEKVENLKLMQTFRDPLDAIQWLSHHETDVIFLDINMPMMNAWDFLKEYQTIQPDFGKKVHLFILSSSVYQKDIDKSGHYDVVTDYIIKPLNKDKLSQIHAKYFGKTI